MKRKKTRQDADRKETIIVNIQMAEQINKLFYNLH